MNLKTKLAAALVMAGSVSMAQAALYNVSANFTDGGIQGQTQFTGSFDWNGTTVSNFTGLLSESMWAWDATLNSGNGAFKAKNGMNTGATPIGSGNLAYVYNQGYGAGAAPLLNLTHQLASSTAGNLVTVSTFLQNSTDVVTGGGYDVVSTNNATKYGNNNAFFTLVFDKTNLTDTSATKSQIVYGDMTPLGLMMPMLTGTKGMTGYSSGGSMGGITLLLLVSPPFHYPPLSGCSVRHWLACSGWAAARVLLMVVLPPSPNFVGLTWNWNHLSTWDNR